MLISEVVVMPNPGGQSDEQASVQSLLCMSVKEGKEGTGREGKGGEGRGREGRRGEVRGRVIIFIYMMY